MQIRTKTTKNNNDIDLYPLASPVLDLAKYLQNHLNISELVVNNGIFIFSLQEKPDLAISVHEFQGSGYSDFSNSNWRGIQITCRSSSRTEAFKLTNMCIRHLHKDGGYITFENGHTTLIKIRTSPTEISVDKQGRHRWVFSIGVLYNYEIEGGI